VFSSYAHMQQGKCMQGSSRSSPQAPTPLEEQFPTLERMLPVVSIFPDAPWLLSRPDFCASYNTVITRTVSFQDDDGGLTAEFCVA
jgi:hypothetical protein